MMPMQEGMNINPEVQVAVLQDKLAQLTIREAMLEAAVQQVLQENTQLHIQIQELSEVKGEPEVVEG